MQTPLRGVQESLRDATQGKRVCVESDLTIHRVCSGAVPLQGGVEWGQGGGDAQSGAGEAAGPGQSQVTQAGPQEVSQPHSLQGQYWQSREKET